MTTQNGVKGLKITSKSNGNSIFLPAVGYVNGASIVGDGVSCYYWSASSYTNGQIYYLTIEDNDASNKYCSRYMGQSIRPVRR